MSAKKGSEPVVHHCRYQDSQQVKEIPLQFEIDVFPNWNQNAAWKRELNKDMNWPSNKAAAHLILDSILVTSQ